MELSIETSLVDTHICWELKNNYLHQYQSQFSTLLQRDQYLDHPTTTGPIPHTFPPNRTHAKNIDRISRIVKLADPTISY